MNLEPDAPSVSWSRKGIKYQAPWRTLEYNLVTVISIWPLTQPVTCEMGFSIFAAISSIKVAPTTYLLLLASKSLCQYLQNDANICFQMDFPYRTIGKYSWVNFNIVVSRPPDVRSKIQEHHANRKLVAFRMMFFFLVF